MDPSSLSIVVVWQDAILSFVAYIGGLSDFFFFFHFGSFEK